MNIQFTKRAFEDYTSLPLQYKELVDKILNKLENGIPVDIKPIQGEKDTFRIRVGKYRMLFNKIQHDILIFKIKKREDVYR